MNEVNTKRAKYRSDWSTGLNDVKNTPKYQPRKPQPLWHSFLIAMLFAALAGLVIGVMLTVIRTGNLPF